MMAGKCGQSPYAGITTQTSNCTLILGTHPRAAVLPAGVHGISRRPTRATLCRPLPSISWGDSKYTPRSPGLSELGRDGILPPAGRRALRVRGGWLKHDQPRGSRIGRKFSAPPIEDHSDRFAVKNLGDFPVSRASRSTQGMDSVLLSSKDYGRFVRARDRGPSEVAASERCFEQHDLVREIRAEQGGSRGPTIRIDGLRR